MKTHLRLRTLALSIGATAVTTLAVAAGTTAPADAAATQCSSAPSGLVCNFTQGSGTHVDGIQAQRLDTKAICGYSARVHIDDAAGNEVFTAETGVISGGSCVLTGDAYIDFPVNRDFPSGSHTYVQWFEGGSQVGGSPEAEIHD